MTARATAFLAMTGLLIASPAAAEFDYTGDMAARFDDIERYDSAEGRGSRKQYRLRFRPEFAFSERWSGHAFIATGNDFGSAYNTIDDNDDEIHVRHLFVRLEDDWGKFEAGVIPPYKGRVSSTGLSAEGWLQGLRGVMNVRSGRLELVLGQLDDLRASRAMSLPEELDYVELEYSGRLTDTWTYEAASDYMLDDAFVRGEFRYSPSSDKAYAAEIIANVSERGVKVVLSAERTLRVGDAEVEWFGYYAYAGEKFGLRAALTEDFLEFGHAIATEFSSPFPGSDRFEWFAKVEVYEDAVRANFGIELSLD